MIVEVAVCDIFFGQLRLYKWGTYASAHAHEAVGDSVAPTLTKTSARQRSYISRIKNTRGSSLPDPGYQFLLRHRVDPTPATRHIATETCYGAIVLPVRRGPYRNTNVGKNSTRETSSPVHILPTQFLNLLDFFAFPGLHSRPVQDERPNDHLSFLELRHDA